MCVCVLLLKTLIDSFQLMESTKRENPSAHRDARPTVVMLLSPAVNLLLQVI